MHCFFHRHEVHLSDFCTVHYKMGVKNQRYNMNVIRITDSFRYVKHHCETDKRLIDSTIESE